MTIWDKMFGRLERLWRTNVKAINTRMRGLKHLIILLILSMFWNVKCEIYSVGPRGCRQFWLRCRLHLALSVCQSVADVSAAPAALTESIFWFAPSPYFIVFFSYYIFFIIFSPWRTTGARLRWPSFLNGGKEKQEQNYPLLVGREETVEPLF